MLPARIEPLTFHTWAYDQLCWTSLVKCKELRFKVFQTASPSPVHLSPSLAAASPTIQGCPTIQGLPAAASPVHLSPSSFTVHSHRQLHAPFSNLHYFMNVKGNSNFREVETSIQLGNSAAFHLPSLSIRDGTSIKRTSEGFPAPAIQRKAKITLLLLHGGRLHVRLEREELQVEIEVSSVSVAHGRDILDINFPEGAFGIKASTTLTLHLLFDFQIRLFDLLSFLVCVNIAGQSE
ncbi:hypothetical protein LXL04_031770 [Taraxacum kok-saghyz]